MMEEIKSEQHETHITMVKGVMNESYREEMELHITAYLGPQHLPYQSLIPITVIYSIIFICGLIGNFSTCIVIAKAHYMRTSTNYYLFNLAIADMLTLIFGSLGFRSGVLSLMLPNAVSLLLYIWASVCLAQVRVGLAFKWMYAPWMMFGICAQIFGLISHVVDETSLRMPSHRPPLSKVFGQTEKALMWLQVDVGFALFACSDWIMIHPSPIRMLITIFIISILPLIAWASEHPKGAIGLTQMSSILHTMACLHVKLIVLDFWGVLSSSLMFTYLLLISLPQDYILLWTLRLETINIIFPALLSRAIVKGFAELSQLQIT